jgi:pyruvate,water dikinase
MMNLSTQSSSSQGFNPITGEWNDSLQGNYLWSGTNLAEANPDVLTPFTCSFRKGEEFGDGASMGLKGHPLAGIVAGRSYINLSVQVSALRPFFGGDTRKALQQVTAWWGDVPEDVEIPLIPVSTKDWWLRVLPNLMKVGNMMARLRKKAPEFVAHMPHRCEDTIRRIGQIKNGPELAALWHDEIGPFSHEVILITNAAATDKPARLEQELRQMVGADDANALLSNLSGLTSPLTSLGLTLGLAKVQRGEMSRADYVAAYGHRGMNEGEAAWPRPLEDPSWLERQLVEFAKAPIDVDVMIAKQHTAYQAAWERFGKCYPGKVRRMQQRLTDAAQAAGQREAVRSEGTRGMRVIRAFALRAGELMDLGEDIFYLGVNEVLAVLAGDETACQYIPARKEMFARYRALPPYPTLIVGPFDPFAWVADPNRRSDIFVASQTIRQSIRSGNTIKGFAGAMGVVEGVVRRLDRLEDSGQLQPGEILVTSMTNIGWTPIFPRLTAIITDLGAPLSHAAIVARELGIPAVVGCGDATMRLKTGDRVRVNGGAGSVEIL